MKEVGGIAQLKKWVGAGDVVGQHLVGRAAVEFPADLLANFSISSFYAVNLFMNLQKSLLSKLIKLCI